MPSTDAKETKHKNSTLPPLTIDLSPSQHPKYAHLWKEKKSQYDNRPPSGWRDILEQKSALRTLKRRGGLFQYEEKRRTRIAESGWKNITVILPEKPKKIDFEAMNALQKEELDKNGASLRNRGNYCFTCWGVVHADVNRAGCCHCMAVTHKACIVKTDGALKSSKDPLESTPWTCPDCVEDVDFNSHFQVIRQRQQYRESMEIFAIVKVRTYVPLLHIALSTPIFFFSFLFFMIAVCVIPKIMQVQSFARMVRYRLDFIFAKIGFTCLQKLFHAKKAWTTLKSYEEKRHRPFRIRIQDVKLFVHSPDAVEGSTVDGGMLPDPVTRKIGEIAASIYDAHFKPGRHFEGTESRYNDLIM